MRPIGSLKQKFLILIDEHPVLISVFALLLVIATIFLLSPLIQPLSISSNVGGVVANHPFTVIPFRNTEYEIVVRSVDTDVRFEIDEANDYITILKEETLSLNPQLTRLNVIFASHPTKLFGFYDAQLRLQITDMSGQRDEYIRIRVDALSMSFRLILSVLLTAPSLQIGWELLKRSDIFQNLVAARPPTQ